MMIRMKKHRSFVQRLLYSYGPHNCLKKSRGCRRLKFNLPGGSCNVGKTLGSDLPYPFFSSLSAEFSGTNSKDI